MAIYVFSTHTIGGVQYKAGTVYQSLPGAIESQLVTAGKAEYVEAQDTPVSVLVSHGLASGVISRGGRVGLMPTWVTDPDGNVIGLAAPNGDSVNPAEVTSREAAWTDLRFPAQGINPAGAAAPPTVDTTLTGFPGTLLFSGALENVICGIAQMPHEWERGTAIKPHIHWSKPVGSASAADWVLYYRHAGMVGDTPGAWVGPITGTLVAGDPAVSDQHLITAFGEIDMTGRIESAIVAWQIRRLGNSDADNNDVRLYEFDLHYQVGLGKFGTDSDIPTQE